METTKICGLKKPGQDDFYDVQDFDDNADILDKHIGALESPAYNDAKNLEELTSGEKYTTAWGKLKKAVKALIDHISDKNNPHGVTKADVGLGKCDNTADVEKSVKYAASAGTAANATAANLAERAYALRVINPDWNGYMPDTPALARVRYDGTNYVWLDADIGGAGKGGACQYAVSAGTANTANSATNATKSTYADAMTVIKSDWKGRCN